MAQTDGRDSKETVPNSDAPLHVIIGGYTEEMDGKAVGISSLVMTSTDAEQVEFTAAEPSSVASPSYLVADPARRLLFACHETQPGAVSSWAVADDGALRKISEVPSEGDAPCHLWLAPNGGQLVVANYASGSVGSFAVGQDGRLSAATDTYTFSGHGPDSERQAGPHAHQVVGHGDGLLVCDLGTDRVHRLRLDGHGRFDMAGKPVVLPPGSGPRHLVVVEEHLVVACELSAELWLARPDGDGWRVWGGVPSSEITPPTTERSYPSAVVTGAGLVFVANRGVGTVAAFRLDPRADGGHDSGLRQVSEFGCGGSWPRDLAVAGDHLWVANQTDHQVCAFRCTELPPKAIDFVIDTPSPACVVVSPMSGSAQPEDPVG